MMPIAGKASDRMSGPIAWFMFMKGDQRRSGALWGENALPSGGLHLCQRVRTGRVACQAYVHIALIITSLGQARVQIPHQRV